jgi:hypothetical protein
VGFWARDEPTRTGALTVGWQASNRAGCGCTAASSGRRTRPHACEAAPTVIGESAAGRYRDRLLQQPGEARTASVVAPLLDALATLAQPPQHHQILVLVVPLPADRDMGLDEPSVIDRPLALGEIHVGLDGVKGEVAHIFGPAVDPRRGRRYQRTASTITSGGKRKPAKVERGGIDWRDGRVVLMVGVSPPRPHHGQRNCETARVVWRDHCQDRHWYRGMTHNATDALMGCLGTELSAVVPAPAWRPAMLA